MIWNFIQIGAGLSQAKSIMFMLSSANVLMFYNQFIESTSEEKKKKMEDSRSSDIKNLVHAMLVLLFITFLGIAD